MIPISVLCMLLLADAPETMTKMDVRVTGPGIRQGTYAALPKLIYRSGAKYARMENAPDAKAKMEKITIISEPDAYSIDLIDHTGTHAIDQGGPNDMHLPMVLPFDPMHKLGALDRLEFGAELDFFEKAGAIKSSGPIVNSKPTNLYTLRIPGGKATLITRDGSSEPVFVTWNMKDGTYRYEYSLYVDMPFDQQLFARPNGVKFREIPPPGPDEHNE